MMQVAGPLRGALAGAAVAALLAGAARAELPGPAELPPPDYAGGQYVDTQGCLFLRAGPPGQVVWVPRVTREGVPLCGFPPSGVRVPAEGDPAPAGTPDPGEG